MVGKAEVVEATASDVMMHEAATITANEPSTDSLDTGGGTQLGGGGGTGLGGLGLSGGTGLGGEGGGAGRSVGAGHQGGAGSFTVHADNDARADATTLTVRGPDVDGVLASMTAALAISGCKVIEVHATTRVFEDTLEDTFVVQTHGRQVKDGELADVSHRLLAATKDPLQARSLKQELSRLQNSSKHNEHPTPEKALGLERGLTAKPASEWEHRGNAGVKAPPQKTRRLPSSRGDYRPVLHACKNCQKARTACTDQRPCLRCTRLGLQCEGEAKPVRRACDHCKRAKTKCDLNDAMPCARCVRLGLECTASGNFKKPLGLQQEQVGLALCVPVASSPDAAVAVAVQAAVATTATAQAATALATVPTVVSTAPARDDITEGEATAALEELLDEPVSALGLPPLNELGLSPLERAASRVDPMLSPPHLCMDILSDGGLDAFLSVALADPVAVV